MSKLMLALATIGLLAVSPALAAVAFESADANGDGAVTMTEAKTVMPDLTVERFATADSNGDGVLSSDEFATLGG